MDSIDPVADLTDDFSDIVKEVVERDKDVNKHGI